jgi:hypothetical protein
VAEVSFTFTLGFCLLTDQQLKDERSAASASVDPYGNAFECERQSLLDGIVHALSFLLHVDCRCVCVSVWVYIAHHVRSN